MTENKRRNTIQLDECHQELIADIQEQMQNITDFHKAL